jgi:hypothetical protein
VLKSATPSTFVAITLPVQLAAVLHAPPAGLLQVLLAASARKEAMHNKAAVQDARVFVGVRVLVRYFIGLCVVGW